MLLRHEGAVVAALTLAGLSACSTVPTVSNEDLAIAIFRDKCSDKRFPPFGQSDTHLERNRWLVHSRTTMYVSRIPRVIDTYLVVPGDGSRPGGCVRLFQGILFSATVGQTAPLASSSKHCSQYCVSQASECRREQSHLPRRQTRHAARDEQGLGKPRQTAANQAAHRQRGDDL